MAANPPPSPTYRQQSPTPTNSAKRPSPKRGGRKGPPTPRGEPPVVRSVPSPAAAPPPLAYPPPPASTIPPTSQGASRTTSTSSIQFEQHDPPQFNSPLPSQTNPHNNTLFVSPQTEPRPAATSEVSDFQVRALEARIASLRGLYDTLDGHNDEVEAEYVRIRGILDNLRDGLLFTVRDELHGCRLEFEHIKKTTSLELAAFQREMGEVARVLGRALVTGTTVGFPLFSPPSTPPRQEPTQRTTFSMHEVANSAREPLEEGSFSSLVSSTSLASDDAKRQHKKVSTKRLSKVKHVAREWRRQVASLASENIKLRSELRDRDAQFGRYLSELRGAHDEQIRTCQSHIFLLNNALRDVGGIGHPSAANADADQDPKQRMIEGAALRLLKAIEETHTLMTRAKVPLGVGLESDPGPHRKDASIDVGAPVHRTHSTASSAVATSLRNGVHIISPSRHSKASGAPLTKSGQSQWAKEVLERHHKGVERHHKGPKKGLPM